MRDLGVVLAKEWLELRRSDSTWVALATLAVFLGLIGVLLPWLFGPSWLRAPWAMIIWAWIPMFLVTTVTADTFAGERERRTLETLLATRLSDGSILWGKWLASVLWVAGAMLLALPLGVISLNLMFAGGPFLPSPWQVLGTISVVLAAGGLGGALGILVSLRASSVRHAQQVLAIIMFLIAFVPIVVLKLAPDTWTTSLFAAVTTGSPVSAAWRLVALFAVATTPILAVAGHRFRRGRIPLR